MQLRPHGFFTRSLLEPAKSGARHLHDGMAVKLTALLLTFLCAASPAATRTKPEPSQEKTTSEKSGKKSSTASRREQQKSKTGDKNTENKEKDKDKSKEKKPVDSPDDGADKKGPSEALTASLRPEELTGFGKLPADTQALLRYGLSLTGRQLSYKMGSADPDTGGTDCSGYVYHVLKNQGHTNVPRQADEMYAWAWRAGTFRACNGNSMDTFEFKELRPGDLLFWVNSTQSKTDRDPPVTHVMIYLGTRVSDGKPVTAGASDGRSYDGRRMSGVSVFDFRLPPADGKARFIGYAHLPEAKAPETKPASPPSREKTPRGKRS